MNEVRRLVTVKQLRIVYGIPFAPVHIRRLSADGKFPKAIDLSKHRIAFYADEVEQWVATRPQRK